MQSPHTEWPSASAYGEALRWLSGDIDDEVEVLVEVKDGEPGQLGGGCDHEVGDGGCAVVAVVGEQHLHLDNAILDRWGLLLDRHRCEGRPAGGKS